MAKHAEPGELLAAGSPVITVARLDEVWVRAYLPETQLGKVKLGQQATVTSDTWKGRKYQGTVSFISSEAEFTPPQRADRGRAGQAGLSDQDYHCQSQARTKARYACRRHYRNSSLV